MNTALQHISPVIEKQIDSKRQLLNAELRRETLALEQRYASGGMWASGAHAQELSDLIIKHITTLYNEVSAVLLSEVKTKNSLELETVERGIDTICNEEKKIGAQNIIALLKKQNNENIYGSLNFDNIIQHILNSKSNDLRLKYLEIQNTLETQKTAKKASRAALFSAIAASISAFCALLTLILKKYI